MIDCHLNWCGPCDVMENNYRGLFFNLVDATNRIEFWTASEDVIPEDVMAKLENGPLSCKPRFIVYEGGEKKAEVDGADFTQLEAAINKYIPQLDD